MGEPIPLKIGLLVRIPKVFAQDDPVEIGRVISFDDSTVCVAAVGSYSGTLFTEPYFFSRGEISLIEQ